MAKRKRQEAPPLAHYWNVPSDVEWEDGIGQPLACLATTYEFHAGFFETQLLPRFLGQKLDNSEDEFQFIFERETALATVAVAVLVDVEKFDAGQTTLSWDQLPIAVPGGIQHSKLTLLVWENFIRLIVASANLTTSGYRKNREVFSALDLFDDEESVPLEILRDALDFLHLLSGWARALPAATDRLRATIEETRQRIGRWQYSPESFTPRERPRAKLILGHPQQDSISATSPLGQLLEFWPTNKLEQVTVVTPFVSQGVTGDDPVLEELSRLPLGARTEGWLVVPESPVGDQAVRPAVQIPKSFGDHWNLAFRNRGGAHVVPVPVADTRIDRNRTLHSKAILLQGTKYDVLMVGSSNFTPHGQGVGVYNCEANLAVQDTTDYAHGRLSLEQRLDLDHLWDSCLDVEDVDWHTPDLPNDDEPETKVTTPLFFACASCSQRTGVIRLHLDRSQPEPPQWYISIAGETQMDAPSLLARDQTDGDREVLEHALPMSARTVHLVALRIRWRDMEEAEHESRLPISVEDKADILPASDSLNLSVDAIIECLLRGKDPRPVEPPNGGRKKEGSGKKSDRTLDSLRAVDTSGYLLYRVRRLGKALEAVAQRIGGTPLTTHAMRYRLIHDPLGPVRLATAISNAEITSLDDGDISTLREEQARIERIFRLYAVAETSLCVAHVSKRLQREAGHDFKPLVGLFRESVQTLVSLTFQLQQETDRTLTPANLRKYIEEVSQKAARLVGTRTKETSHAG